MVTVITQPCPESKYSIKCPYMRTPRFVVVHNTGNDAPAKNEVAYMQRNDREVSFHVAVDDKEVLQCLPFGRNAWASGDGTGEGNMYGIHIEICWSLSGWQRFLNMVKSELDKLNKKEEPELTEAQVRESAKKEAAAEFARQNPTYDTLDQVPDYWREDIRWLVDWGILKGNANGKLGLARSEAKAAVLVKRGLEKAGVA